jgi:predicted ester cyclase
MPCRPAGVVTSPDMTQNNRTPEQEHDIGVFRQVIEEGFNRGNLDALDDLFTADFHEHQSGFPTPDLAGLKRGITGVRRALPDIRLEIADTIVEADKVSFLLRGEGTHQGQLGPLPGSGKHVTWDVIDVCRFRDGKIAEHWGVPDRMGILEQVGMPRPPRWLMKLMMKRNR